jgi:hypothetical protein
MNEGYTYCQGSVCRSNEEWRRVYLYRRNRPYIDFVPLLMNMTKATYLKFYTLLAKHVGTCGSEIWMRREKDVSRKESPEIDFLRSVKGCTRNNRRPKK